MKPGDIGKNKQLSMTNFHKFHLPGLSLGTSDTVFVWLDSPKPQLTGHVWPSPVSPAAFMALLCYKNGSLTRERVRDAAANGDWAIFSELIESTPRGNFGNIGETGRGENNTLIFIIDLGFYFDHPEIVPHGIQGDFRFSRNDEPASRFASSETEVRALVEGQMVAKRLHAERLGFSLSEDTRILVTGGASVNKAIQQIIADVFNASVYTMVS